ILEHYRLPIHSDHTMSMTNVNTQTDMTLGVLENLHLNFRTANVFVQVQILAQANFEMLLGRPFHCLMSASMDNFLDRLWSMTLHNPNSSKEFKLPT
ncbi:hypothetical protein PAXRUDRAFT_119272, partial [Paxillus rubicundulus Ve08.2h10]